MATTASTASAAFNGNSTYAAQLQQVITRSVAIASLPITVLQNQQSAMTAQQSELQTLGSDFQSLQNAVATVDSAAGAGSNSATVSTPAVGTAALSAGALVGTYSVDVTGVGSQTNTISNLGSTTVTDPTTGNISASSSYTLTAGGHSYTVTDAANSLEGLASAINASGASVQATVVNVGGSAAPDYRLSIQSTQYAPVAIQLNDGAHDLLNTLTTGTNVTYQVNGSTTTATSDSRNLAISPGVTLKVLAVGSTSVAVSQNVAGIGSALTSFATAYNAAVDELTKNRGQNGGALGGQSVVSDLSSALQKVANYSLPSAGSVQSLSDIGLSFDTNGHLQFDASTFNQASSTSLAAVTTFLGSATGGGFLQAATNVLTTVADPISGLIVGDISSLADSLNTITGKISTDQSRVTQLQTTLTAQLSAADAAIAALEQQQTQITDLFAAEQQQARTNSG